MRSYGDMREEVIYSDWFQRALDMLEDRLNDEHCKIVSLLQFFIY